MVAEAEEDGGTRKKKVHRLSSPMTRAACCSGIVSELAVLALGLKQVAYAPEVGVFLVKRQTKRSSGV